MNEKPLAIVCLHRFPNPLGEGTIYRAYEAYMNNGQPDECALMIGGELEDVKERTKRHLSHKTVLFVIEGEEYPALDM